MKNKSLFNSSPEIIKEWDWDKNTLDPQKILRSYRGKVFWKCEKDPLHKWEATPCNRIYSNTGCPYCSGMRVVKEDSLAFKYPELLKEWDYEKNGVLNPYEIGISSNKRLHWICEKNKDHRWTTQPRHRTIEHTGCPYCYGRFATNDHNIVIDNPDIMVEWNYDRNIGIDPHCILSRSGKRVWWKCKKCSREWVATPHMRITGQSCPYCCRPPRKVCKENCLSTVFPHIAEEWDYKKNNPLTPDKIIYATGKKYWWTCCQKHSWFASAHSRTTSNSNCPYCSKIELKNGIFVSSLIEAYYYLILENSGIEFIHDNRYNETGKRFRFDFYIPEINTYIEVTSFSRKDLSHTYDRSFYIKYLRKIVQKKQIVNKKGGNFNFIQRILNKEELNFVNKHIKRKAVL